MIIRSLSLKSFRCFDDLEFVPLSRLTVIFGANNSGKSSLLKAIRALELGTFGEPAKDIRVGALQAQISLQVGEIAEKERPMLGGHALDPMTIRFFLDGNRADGGGSKRGEVMVNGGIVVAGDIGFSPIEPQNLIVPFLSRRKSQLFSEDIREPVTNMVSGTFENLAAKLNRMTHPRFFAHERYVRCCEEVLGFVPLAFSSPNGMKPGVLFDGREKVQIEQMGDGVAHIASLIESLCVSQGKIFLIEEPENDLHPRALGALLSLIVESSAHNQFIISTHSPAVVSRLASIEGHTLLNVIAGASIESSSRVEDITGDRERRILALRELGADPVDVGLYEGWILFEESSAESVIKQFLIPMFAPRLLSLCTLSTNGADEAPDRLRALERHFLFSHLESLYRDRTWIVLDGDPKGAEVKQKILTAFGGDREPYIRLLSEPCFENYYPQEFRGRVSEVLAISDRKKRRQEKRALLLDVLTWLRADLDRAKSSLRVSAGPVIELLLDIERALDTARTSSRVQ